MDGYWDSNTNTWVSGTNYYTGSNPGAQQLSVKNPNLKGIETGIQAHIDKFNSGSGLSNINSNSGGNSTNWLGKGGYLDTASTGIQAVSAGVGAWNGFENMKLAKNKFAFEKAATNRNVANQGLAYNTELDRRRNVGYAMATGAMSSADRNAYNAKTQAMHADTSAIG